MTKEALEQQFEECFDKATHATEGGYGADTTHMNGLWDRFSPAIFEFAKQQSIAFSKWKWGKWDNRWFTFENGFWYYTFEQGTSMGEAAYNKHYRKTDEQLYELFTQPNEIRPLNRKDEKG